MSEALKFVLPEKITKSSGTSPRDLIILSQPKMGKSVILGDFTVKYNSVVFNLEKGGYEYIDAKTMDIYPKEATTDIEAFDNYIKWRNKLLKDKEKYDVLIIDGLSDLDRMSELGGTKAYMNSIIGRRFNVINEDNKSKTAPKYKPENPGFKSVLTLPEGAGYKHTRDWFMDQFKMFREIAPYRIYAAHVADKYIKDKTREEVVGQELFLTGKLKNIFATKVTALGKLIADKNKRLINFEVLNDNIIAGSRAPFLKGKILISEQLEDDSIITFWENIFSKDLLSKI